MGGRVRQGRLGAGGREGERESTGEGLGGSAGAGSRLEARRVRRGGAQPERGQVGRGPTGEGPGGSAGEGLGGSAEEGSGGEGPGGSAGKSGGGVGAPAMEGSAESGHSSEKARRSKTFRPYWVEKIRDGHLGKGQGQGHTAEKVY